MTAHCTPSKTGLFVVVDVDADVDVDVVVGVVVVVYADVVVVETNFLVSFPLA